MESYAADFRSKSLTDEKAKKLIDEAVAIVQAEANLKSTYAPQLSKGTQQGHAFLLRQYQSQRRRAREKLRSQHAGR